MARRKKIKTTPETEAHVPSRGARHDGTTVSGAMYANADYQCFGCHDWSGDEHGRIFRRSDRRLWHTTCWFGSDFGKRAIAEDVELKDDLVEIVYTPIVSDGQSVLEANGTRLLEGYEDFGANAGYYGVYDPRPNVGSFGKLENACARYREIFNREPVAAVVSRGDADAIEAHALLADEAPAVRIYVREGLPVNYFYVGKGR